MQATMGAEIISLVSGSRCWINKIGHGILVAFKRARSNDGGARAVGLLEWYFFEAGAARCCTPQQATLDLYQETLPRRRYKILVPNWRHRRCRLK